MIFRRNVRMPDVLPFLHAWITNPRRVAAIAPSSRMLGEVITAEINAESAPVIELGPGTGVFTEALLQRGVPEQMLTLIELNVDFARLLHRRYPLAETLTVSAARLGKMTLFEGRPAGAVVSGLPLLSMSPKTVMGILRGSFHHLRLGGSFYQFTYGPRCPVSEAMLARLGLRSRRMGWVLQNVPPATVYCIERADEPRRQA
jgi:phosphatidylethanolamine/phosphatidyl-N-methylethanolamine N-methyltransferase